MALLEKALRTARGGQWVDNLVRDLKYALRYFVRTPLSSITIVLTLALGIGFSSAVFSVINSILTRPAPGVPDDPALVKIRAIASVRPFDRRMSYQEVTAYAGLTDKFESVVGWVTSGVVVDGGNTNVPAVTGRAYFATPNYFGALGIRLTAGRGFEQSQFRELSPPELSAIVTPELASERFGDARAAIGKQLEVNDVTVTIVGVAPPRFSGVIQSGETRALWLPLSSWQTVTKVNEQVFVDPNARRFEALARLRPGVTMKAVLPAVRVVAARVDAAAKAQSTREWTATADVVRLRGRMEVTGRYHNELGPAMVIFSAIALLILLVCTTTVNSLLIGGAVARRYEIGVRLALGASRWRIVHQLLTEVAILAVAGGALGMWLFGGLSRLTEVANDGFDVSPNWVTIGFTMLYALLTATLCGLSPALHATRAGVSEVLKDSAAGTRGKSRLQRAFVVAQIAVAQPLMIGLAAVLSSAVSDLAVKGNATVREQLMIADLNSYVGFSLKEPDRIPGLVHRLSTVPGIAAVLPISDGQAGVSLELPPPSAADTQSSHRKFSAELFEVPPDYFRAVEARIVRGREFVASDTTLTSTVTPVIIVESLAVEVFRSRDPVGQRLVRTSAYDGRRLEMEVVGVVRMTRESHSLEWDPDAPPVFVPFSRQLDGSCRFAYCAGGTKLLIRTIGSAEPLIPTVMAIAREEARMLPLARTITLGQHDRARRQTMVGAVSVGAVCGAVALILASIGLYGMVSIAVGQRLREIGVRVALGAHARQVVRLFFADGLRATLVGLAIGLPVSVAALVALMRALGVPWRNVPVLAVLVTLAVVGVASLASWLPARRAARVDPMVVLRTD